MQRFQSLLVVVESQQPARAALDLATRIAVRNRATLRVVEVMRHLPTYARMLVPGMNVEDLEDGLTAARLEGLDELAAPAREAGVEVSTEVLWGTPFVEVIREAVEGHHDLVLKVANSDGEFSQTLFGSTDLHLLRKCPAPVWLLDPRFDAGFRRVLAAIDPSGETSEARALDRTILELASSLVEVQGGELDVVHCWDLPGDALLARRMSDDEVLRVREAMEAHARASFDRALRRHARGLPGDRRHLLEGDPGRVVPELAERIGADLVVMGTVGRSGIPGLFVGNTAERVLHRVRASVLTVKPAGFRSPVATNLLVDSY